jgi:hypothetical protein
MRELKLGETMAITANAEPSSLDPAAPQDALRLVLETAVRHRLWRSPRRFICEPSSISRPNACVTANVMKIFERVLSGSQ